MSLTSISKASLTAQLNQAEVAHSEIKGRSKVPPKDVAQIKKLSADFESIFLNMMFKSMRKSVPKSEAMGGGGHGEDIFKDMLDGEYAKIMAEQRSTGIANSIEKELLKTLEYQANSIAISAGKQAYSDKSLHGPSNQAKIVSGK